jgi:hypothetical protein
VVQNQLPCVTPSPPASCLASADGDVALAVAAKLAAGAILSDSRNTADESRNLLASITASEPAVPRVKPVSPPRSRAQSSPSSAPSAVVTVRPRPPQHPPIRHPPRPHPPHPPSPMLSACLQRMVFAALRGSTNGLQSPALERLRTSPCRRRSTTRVAPLHLVIIK